MTPNRKKFLFSYIFVYFVVASCLYFVLHRSYKNFSKDKLNYLTNTVSKYRDKTDNPCQYAIRGDPKEVGNNYVKINFWCSNGTAARSTLALNAIDDISFQGVINEYARIINFDPKMLVTKNWFCFVADRVVTDTAQMISAADTIDCYDKKPIPKK